MTNVLVVVDMQNDFIDGALGTKEAEAIVDNVVHKIHDFEGKIIVTQDTHLPNYMETQEGRKLPVPHCICGTEGWKLNQKVSDALRDKKDVLCIEKYTFGSTLLPELFKSYLNGREDLEFTLIGLCTDICVISNAMLLKAYYKEANIIVDASCCAGVTPESHKNALEAMKMCQIDVIEE